MPMFRDSRQHAMAHVQSNYSNDLLNVLGYLLYPAPGRMRNLNELMPMIGARFYMELETQSMHTTLLERVRGCLCWFRADGGPIVISGAACVVQMLVMQCSRVCRDGALAPIVQPR